MIQRQHLADPSPGHHLEAHGIGEREVLIFVALEPMGDRTILQVRRRAHHFVR